MFRLRPLVLSLVLQLSVVSIQPTLARWERTHEQFQALGYHWFIGLPQEEPEENAEYVADDLTCLGLGCYDKAVILTGLGLWISGFPRDARLEIGGRELIVPFEPDDKTLKPFGRLLMRGRASSGVLDSLRSVKQLTVRTDDSGPFTFSMEGYVPALSQTRSLCR